MADNNTDPYDDLQAWAGSAAPQATPDDPYQDLKAWTAQQPAAIPQPASNQVAKPEPAPTKPNENANKSWIDKFKESMDSYDETKQKMGEGMSYGPMDVVLSAARPISWFMDQAGGGGDQNRLFRDNVQRQIDERNQEFDQGVGKDSTGQVGRFAGDLAASAPLMGGLGELGEGAVAGGKVGGNILSRFLTGESSGLGYLPAKAAQGALQGAETTGLTSASNNEDPTKQLQNNMQFGAMLNPALAVGRQAVSSAANKLMDVFSSPESAGAKKLMQSLQRDGYQSIDEVHDALQQLGPHASLGDLGPNTMGLMRSAHTVPGEGRNMIEGYLEDRQGGQGARLMDAVNEGLGTQGSDLHSTMDQLVQQQQKDAAPLYKQAFTSNKSVDSPVIDKILATPAGQSAMADARTKMLNDRSLMGLPDAELAEQARDAGMMVPGGVAKGLNLRSLDYVKRSLDQQILDEQGARVPDADKIRILQGLRGDFVNELDKLDTTGGAYKQARDTFGGYAQSMDAMNQGKKLAMQLSNRTSNAQDVQKIIDSVPEAHLPYMRIGVADGLQNIINATSDGGDAVKAIFGNSLKREKLARLFDSPEDFDQFSKVATGEGRMFKTNASILNRSQTAAGLAETADQKEPAIGLDDIMHAKMGNYAGAASNVMRKFLKGGPEMSPERSAFLGGAMTNQKAGLNALDGVRFNGGGILPQYMNILAGAYGIPATEMGLQRYGASQSDQPTQ